MDKVKGGGYYGQIIPIQFQLRNAKLPRMLLMWWTLVKIADCEGRNKEEEKDGQINSKFHSA